MSTKDDALKIATEATDFWRNELVKVGLLENPNSEESLRMREEGIQFRLRLIQQKFEAK